MKTMFAILLLAAPLFAADPEPVLEEGFVSLFNGKDFTGEYGAVPVVKKPRRSASAMEK